MHILKEETASVSDSYKKLQYHLNVLHENVEITQAMFSSLESRLSFVISPPVPALGKPIGKLDENKNQYEGSDACQSVMAAIYKITNLQSQIEDILNRLDV